MQISFRPGSTGAKNGPSWVGFRARMVAICHGIVALLRYIFFFEWVIDLARWLITTGGNIAESAFLLATVYVTINTVAHQLIAWLVPDNVVIVLNQVSVIAFSVLPELIIFAAIKVTFDHFKMAFSTKRFDAWVWSVLYLLPTVVFLMLTIVTISSFVNVEAVNANGAPQATGVMLVVRCLAGWSYGMLQMLWVRLGHEGYSNLFARLRDEIASLVAVVAVRDDSISGLEQDKINLQAQVGTLTSTLAARDGSIVDLQAQIEEEKKQYANALASLRSSLESEISNLQTQGSNVDRMLRLRDSSIIGLKDEIEELKEQNAMLDGELVDARIWLAQKSNKCADSESEDVVSEAVVSSEKYQMVKQLMQQAVTNGEKINMKKISADSGISYNTIRRYAQSILNSLVDRKSA